MRPKKELGQNFLQNQEVVESLINTSEPKSGDIYLEIGPGKGAITSVLASRVSRIIAVELDVTLAERLKKSFAQSNNLRIIQADILHYLDLRHHDSKSNKVIGSIPYQITSPLLHALARLSIDRKTDSITLLIQKEVAQKICAQPPKASYLSTFVQTYFDVSYIKTVPKEDFFPVPKVDGAIVKLVPKLQPGGLEQKSGVVEVEKWSAFLHQGFKHPRKMLNKSFDEKILKEVGVNPGQRSQELSLDTWLKLYKTCVSKLQRLENYAEKDE